MPRKLQCWLAADCNVVDVGWVGLEAGAGEAAKAYKLTNYENTLHEYTSAQHANSKPNGCCSRCTYINDIINSSELGHFVLFADDTNIFVVGKDEEQAYTNANMVLDELYKYMVSNQLHINTSKSVYMHFRPHLNREERLSCARTRKYGSEKSLKLANYKLKKVDKVKFLGVIIDDKLTWEAQVEHLKEKLKLGIVVIKRIKKFIPESEYLQLYNALFKSHISAIV